MPSAARKGKGREEPVQATEAALPLGKQLAHTDKKVRDQAVRNLAAFLSRGSGEGESSGYVRLSDDEMAKLWKGLFYCFWMSDKPLVQQALASELSELLLKVNPTPSSSSLSASELEAERFAASLTFLEGFWEAMIREWNGIDRLRMDKFLLFVRRWVNATFRLLARSGWASEAVDAVNGVLSGKSGPLTWQDHRLPSSIPTHLADVYLEELDKVLASDDIAPCPLPQVLSPLITLLARTPHAKLRDRLLSSVFDPLLDALTAASGDASGGDDDDRPVKRRKDDGQYSHITAHSRAQAGAGDAEDVNTVRGAVLKAMFAAAADAQAVESNRRRVYKLWRERGGDDDDE